MRNLFLIGLLVTFITQAGIVPGGGGGGGTPSGPAGGVLSGTYPNPTLAADRVRIAGDTMTGTLVGPTINVTGLTASRAMVTDGSKNLSSSAVTATELGFVSGVTEAIQTQFGNRVLRAGDTMTGTLRGTTILVNDGAVGSPSYAFGGDTTTGLFRVGAATIGYVAAGVEQFRTNGNGVFLSRNGSASAPALGFTADATSGLFRISGSNNMAFATNAQEAGRITASQNWQVGTTTPIAFTAERFSIANSDSAGGASAYSTLATQISLTSVTAYTSSAPLASGFNRLQRTVATSTTDTAPMGAQLQAVRFNVSAAQTYTNSSTDGVFGLMVDTATNQGAGAVAATNYSALYVKADSLNTGTTKSGLRIGNISGATNNWAIQTGTGPVTFGDALLVGTTSNPNSWSQRNATSQNAGATLLGIANTSNGSSATANFRLENDTDVGGILLRNSSTNTAYAGANSVNVGTVTAAGMSLITNNTSRLTVTSGGDVQANTGNLIIQTAGKGLQIKEGSNAMAGVTTLVGGTALVTTSAVATGDRILLTGQNLSGTAGELSANTIVNGTSFVITSASVTDTRDVFWMIVRPSP